MEPFRSPGKGSTFVGIAAAAFATGPTLLAIFWAVRSLSAETPGGFGLPRLGGIPLTLLLASLICLIGSVPAACVNAYVLSRAAKNEMDAPWFSALSGGLIGALVAVLMGAPGLDGLGILFAVTGSLMGFLHWLIAIRPRRRWRLHMLRDAVAIRAME